MNRKLLYAAGGLAIVLVGYFALRGSKAGNVSDVIVDLKRGPFKVEIETTGELEAKNSVKILGPTQLRDFRIWQATG